MKKILMTGTILFIVDRAIKSLIAFLIPFNDNIVVIKDFFYITYVKNIGAAWSILSGKRIILILIAILAIGLIYKFFIKDKKLSDLEKITYGILLAGITGNLFDRIYYGYVIDYLQVIIFNYHFPIFNLADSLIVVSVLLISYKLLKEGE